MPRHYFKRLTLARALYGSTTAPRAHWPAFAGASRQRPSSGLAADDELGKASSGARPFRIDVPDAKLARSRAAVAAAELPPAPADDADWRYGVDVRWLKGFLDYWATEHDWRAEEARLNAYPQFLARVDGLDIHFFHVRGSASRPRPLIMTHGWPGSAYEFVGVIDQLCFPRTPRRLRLGVPSIPGVGFSDAPPRPSGRGRSRASGAS